MGYISTWVRLLEAAAVEFRDPHQFFSLHSTEEKFQKLTHQSVAVSSVTSDLHADNSSQIKQSSSFGRCNSGIFKLGRPEAFQPIFFVV